MFPSSYILPLYFSFIIMITVVISIIIITIIVVVVILIVFFYVPPILCSLKITSMINKNAWCSM